MQKPRKIPMRQCLGCREHKPKKELLRVVRSPEGGISFDPKGKKPGRGAYICPTTACFTKARKSSALARALECAIPDEIYDTLSGQLEAAGEDLKKSE